jgi:hypothetical protein
MADNKEAIEWEYQNNSVQDMLVTNYHMFGKGRNISVYLWVILVLENCCGIHTHQDQGQCKNAGEKSLLILYHYIDEPVQEIIEQYCRRHLYQATVGVLNLRHNE